MKTKFRINKFNLIFSFLALYLFATSCKKVIDVDLNESNPKPVFEAYMENDSTCYVKAGWTSSYYDNSTSPAIINAVMTISDQVGNSEILAHLGNGIYRGNTLIGTIGNAYSLSIDLDGNNYIANSTMPPLTVIDSFTIQPAPNFGGGGGPGGGGGGGPQVPKFWVFANYTDSANYTNYYAKQTTYWDSVEAEFTTDYGIQDDDLSDGLSARTFTTFKSFKQGDSLFVELASIDYPTYLYFKTLQDAISGAGFASAAPANPVTNFSNGALGYFGAWSKDGKPFIVP